MKALRPFTWEMVLQLACLCAAASVAACGGSPSNGAMREEAAQGDVQSASAERHGKAGTAPDSPGHRQVGPAGETEIPPAGQHYDLIILNERVVHQDLDQLDPRQGKGYQSLRAFIYVKGMQRSSSPVASIKPICMEPTRCEYLPPRKAGLAERYVVSIPDDSVAQLSSDQDVIVIRAQTIEQL